ncbi:MAG: ABC transporter permease [Eubacteriaceae bacterium]|nr:ABC transporter permease [Eubacteriaceae bacterium]
MFTHIYLYKLKNIIRDRNLMFWTLMFPIILSVLFWMAFSNLTKGEVFHDIKIAVINDTAYKENVNFDKALSYVSADNEDKLFDVTYTTMDNAKKLLKDNQIEGYIYFDDGLNLTVKTSGINESIIKEFLDYYVQTTSTATTIMAKNPSVHSSLAKDLSNKVQYLNEVPAGSANPDTVVYYFYTLIAMTCLYGSFWGQKEVSDIQANQSYVGARVNIAPTHKLKVFSISMLAAVTIQLIEIFVLLLFLIFILKIDFGRQIGYIVLTCFAGTLTGVSFGAFVSSCITKKEGIKIAVLIGGSMIMSFLSGMMYAGIKTLISRNLPVLSYINPANLIADSFYSLYYYSGYSHYFLNTALLCAFTLLFSFLTYITLRRQKYASI